MSGHQQFEIEDFVVINNGKQVYIIKHRILGYGGSIKTYILHNIRFGTDLEIDVSRNRNQLRLAAPIEILEYFRS